MRFTFLPEEFIVEEIAADGTVLELDRAFSLGSASDSSLERDYFTHFVMQKREWNTMQALSEIARRLHVKPQRFDFAGTKDRNAITTQLCSAFAVPPERLLSANVKDVKINGAWKAREKIRLGDLKGNRFTITLSKTACGFEPSDQATPGVAGLANPKDLLSAAAISSRASSHSFLFPNFFGSQRFGSLRGNSHLVGREILKGDLESAALVFLAGEGTGEDKADSVSARKRLLSEKDFAAALEYYPPYLKYERNMLAHLSEKPRDFAGAFRTLPRTLSLMFIHAFQSFLFNQSLDQRLLEKKQWSESEEAPLPGSEVAPDATQALLLEKDGLTQESFKIKTLAFLSSKGGTRRFFVRLRDFAIVSENPVRLRFSLDSGCYATTALEFLLSDKS